MAITLGSNIASLRGQRQLAKTSQELGTVFQRLSSGQRINKASDDAAGLTIADSLNVQSRIFNQGVRNLNDGQSLLAIADSAIENLSDIVMRLEELASQAANGVYTKKQRMAMDDEAQALSKEFFRISKAAEFNGQRLFTGELSAINLQAGVGTHAVINASVAGDIGTGAFNSISSTSMNSSYSITTGDLNGDGILDLITADLSVVRVALGTGNGSFGQNVSYAVGGNPRSVAVGDFNGDGFLDLVSADTTGTTVSILFGTGKGTFAPRVSYFAGTQPYVVTTGDINSDGLLDIVAADNAGGAVSILLGTGNGTFGSRISISAGAATSSVTTGDFNNDGLLDIATTSGTNSTLDVMLGLGNGAFSPRVSYVTGLTPNSIAAGDFNGDGSLDLVAGNYSSNTVSVFLGTGNGAFGAGASYGTGAGPLSLTTGDFNGDGVLDLVTADYYYTDSTASVLLGRGNGTFEPRASYGVGDEPTSIAAADMNGDGVLDLVTASLNAPVSIHLGRTRDGVAPILQFSLRTLADARQALPVFQRKREQLAAQRGEIGSYQARIDVARNVFEVSSENFKAAESRIRDADVAHESSRLVRLNILQQAASAILAQANQQPALALQLLGRT